MSRRTFMAAAAGSSCLAAGGGANAGRAPARPHKRIACEEGFWPRENFDAIMAYLADPLPQDREVARHYHTFWGSDRPDVKTLLSRLTDIGAGRIADMDAAGIDMQLIISPSGVQLISDRAKALELARNANERLANAVRAYPRRFAALAAAPPQYPEQAAMEIEHAVRNLGLSGFGVNSHTQNEYLDMPEYRPIWETLNALKAPIYIHPREPSAAMIKAYEPYGLQGSAWGYAAEVGIHSLKLIMSGLFDDFPDLQVVIGHGGESIPFFLDRLDNRYLRERLGDRLPKKLKRLPSEYFKAHFSVTTSGMNYHAPLKLCRDVLGPDRVLFAVDYPHEDNAEAVRLIDSPPMTADDLRKICQTNAERVFNIRARPPPPPPPKGRCCSPR